MLLSMFCGTLAYAESFDNAVESPKLVILLIGVSSAILLAAIAWVASRGGVLETGRPQIILIALSILAILQAIASAFYGDYPYFVWHELPLYLCVGTLFVAFTLGLFPDGTIDKVLMAFTLAALINALFGLHQYYFGPIEGIREVAPPAGLFGNRNFSSEVSAAALPVCLGLLIRSNNRTTSLLLSISIGVLGGYLLMCFARATLLALVLVTPLLFIVLIRTAMKPPAQRPDRLFAYLAVAVITAMVLPLLPHFKADGRYNVAENKITRLDHDLSEATSFGNFAMRMGSSRLITWINSLEAVKERPWFGHGFGSWPSLYQSYAQAKLYDETLKRGQSNHHAHNFYIEILTGTGIVGFFLMSAIAVLTIFYPARAHFRSKFKEPGLERFLLHLSSVFIILFTAFFSMPLDLQVLPFILAALLVSISKGPKDLHTNGTRLRLAKSVSASLFFLIVTSCLYGVYRGYQIREVEIMAEQLEQLFHSNQYKDALELGPKIIELDKSHETVNNRMAIMLFEEAPEIWYPYLRNIEEAYPNRPTNLAFLGANYMKRRDDAKALHYWDRLTKVVPGDQEALKQAALLAHKLDNIPRAIGYCQQLLDLEPQNYEYKASLENLKRLQVKRSGN